MSSALVVYLALSEIASDKRAATFQTTHAFIAMRCGLSARTVQQRVKDLVAIGVMECFVPNLKSPATYTLLPVVQPLPNVQQPTPRDVQPVPNDGKPLRNVRQRSKKATLPTSKEGTQEIAKNTFSTKAAKLSPEQKNLADRIEAVLGDQWANDAGKWVERIKAAPSKAERVIAEVESASREGRINTTPAQYGEQIWKEFA